ncbi:MAG TPA: ABC transporter permease [Cyclobacteriaceae bacterium]|nr:ABC transporter permease [Cyclobacteriaceae bacterium]
MFKSYFITGVRNLIKQRGYTLIKIAGLALGLAACIIVFLYIKEDLSYDAFHKHYKQIARVLTIDSAEGVSSKRVGVTEPPLGPAIEAEIPEVVNTVRISNQGRYDLSYEDKTLKCESAFRTESSFFEIFDFPVLEGKREGVLDQPGSIAITQTLARKIFGDENPIGKTIKLNQTTELFVVAVVADPPKNSHLQFDLLRSMTPGENEDGYRQFLQTWQSIAMFTYIQVEDEINEAALNAKIQAITKKNNAYEFFTPVVQPLSDVHLHSKEILFETNANKSDILNVYVLSTIAVLILILAAVNFMNMVTAKSATRAKEIGLRKVIGALRKQLILQYLIESIIVTVAAVVIAVVLSVSATPMLNNLYQRFADPSVLMQPENLFILLGITILIGILSGLYPAFVLSGFKPIAVLKGSFQHSTGGIRLRKALVILQFTISIALMVGTAIVYQQMHFIYESNLGYDREQVLTIQQSGSNIARSANFKTELLRNPNIISAGTASSQIGQQLGRTGITPEGFSTDVNIIASIMGIDESFIPTMGMEMVKGRNFSPEFADSLSAIINEEMARFLKWEDPIGKKISIQNGPNPEDITAYTVVGVIKDFHFATIRHKLEPLFIVFNPQNASMAIKISTSDVTGTIAYIEETWKKVNPGTTFEYNFLDEQFANLYRNEEAFSSMFTHFTILAIVIAGLGLFALSAFTAEQRKKEIGIRKVLGASSGTILYRLSSEFVQLILIAFVLASGLAYFVMSKWLQDFSYSIKMGYLTFVTAGALSLFIALLTISFQALKAAWSNPVDSLRSE